MNRDTYRQLARLVYRDPAKAYAQLIQLADAQPIDGYACRFCGAEILGEFGDLVRHGAEHGRGLDGRLVVRT